jgi:hypothetical protein
MIADQTPAAERLAAGLLLVAVVGGGMLVGPFATNDGPIHMSFARMFVLGPAGALQQLFYVSNITLNPNLLAYCIAGPLIALIGSDGAEMILQLLCIVSLPLAGWFAISAIGQRGLLWPVVMAGFAFNEMFFLGLYNYSLSLSAGLVGFALCVNATRHGGWWWLGFSAALAGTFLAHAGGLIMAVGFAAAWVLPDVFWDVRGGLDWRVLVKRLRPLVLALLTAVILIAQFMFRQGNNPVIYGDSVGVRVLQLARLSLLGSNGRLAGIAAQALAILVVVCAASTPAARVSNWRDLDRQTRLDTVRFVLMIGFGLALAFGFPDTAGGGWTHMKRMILIPYIAAVLLCATRRWGIRARYCILAGAFVIVATMVGAVLRVQRPARVKEFEGATGMAVDCILTQGDPADMAPALAQSVDGYRLIGQTPDGAFRLYARAPANGDEHPARSLCQ